MRLFNCFDEKSNIEILYTIEVSMEVGSITGKGLGLLKRLRVVIGHPFSCWDVDGYRDSYRIQYSALRLIAHLG
jgi:hypothetical protein